MVTRVIAQQVTRQATRAVSGTLGLHGERMSKVDTAWLRMDSQSNLMMIVGVWLLRPGITRDALVQRVNERLLKYPRFTQRVLEDAAGASWVKDRRFDVDRHIVSDTLKPRRGQTAQEALQDRVAELAMKPLDRAHPLWQFHFIEHHDGGSALIARIHHCIADGIALIAVMMSLVDGGKPPPSGRARERGEASPNGLMAAEEWLAGALLKPLTDLTVKAIDTASDGAIKSLSLLTDPQKGLGQTMGGTLEVARLGGQLVSDAAALALMPDDSTTRLKGQPVGRKRVAWCEPIPLDDVKAVSRAMGCTVNDVLLSCVAGAIGHYLRDQGDDVTGQEIRAMVPINLRPMEQAWKLGNRFGLVPLVLPIGVSNPVERLYEVRRRMNSLKGSLQPLLAFGLLSVAGLLIKPAQDAMLGLFGRKTTAVMTNVPGPAKKLSFCGSTLEQTLFWVPQTGTVGVGVSILSYGGGVQFGLITDAALCPDPARIIDAFRPEFDQLLTLSLMLPWGEVPRD